MERECGGCPLLLQHAAPSSGDVDSIFANRMQLAGITPHDRIAIAVSGGPDSMALCILTARWWQQQQQVKGLSHSVIEEAAAGMMMPLLSKHVVGMVVDHGLRPESAMEALSVQHWLARLGMECQVLKCNWMEGVPASGHLQEAARNARYNLMEQACRRHSIRILLMAHHADDQAELFMMRMARGSGVIGLAGMAFISSIFPRKPLLDGTCDLLLIRPLLDLIKHDLYRVCEEAGQEWIEDPTNRKQIFARNCIRQALEEPPFDELRVQIQHLIAACRKTRALLDKERDKLLQDIVSVSQIVDILSLLGFLLQFIAQREKPPRGRALQKLMERIQLQPLQAPILSRGCHVAPTPGSKGSKIMVCFSPDSPSPAMPSEMSLLPSSCPESRGWSSEVLQIPTSNSLERKCHSPRVFEIPGSNSQDCHVPVMEVKDGSPSVLEQGKAFGLISEAGMSLLQSLRMRISQTMMKAPKAEGALEEAEGRQVRDLRAGSRNHQLLPFGESCYFMNRFFVSWSPAPAPAADIQTDIASGLSLNQNQRSQCCLLAEKPNVWVRYFGEEDWRYLSGTAKSAGASRLSIDQRQKVPLCTIHLDSERWVTSSVMSAGEGANCGKHLAAKAQAALTILRCIPTPVRRGLPVLVNAQGLLLAIPSLGFQRCPWVSFLAIFHPRVPLGGGCASWV
ncbi:unnamed protein product [Sphagnum compactum]